MGSLFKAGDKAIVSIVKPGIYDHISVPQSMYDRTNGKSCTITEIHWIIRDDKSYYRYYVEEWGYVFPECILQPWFPDNDLDDFNDTNEMNMFIESLR